MKERERNPEQVGHDGYLAFSIPAEGNDEFGTLAVVRVRLTPCSAYRFQQQMIRETESNKGDDRCSEP